MAPEIFNMPTGMSLPPPPGVAGGETLSPYWFAGMGGVVAMLAGVAGYLYKRSHTNKEHRNRLLPEVQHQFMASEKDAVLFSTNPLHK